VLKGCSVLWSCLVKYVKTAVHISLFGIATEYVHRATYMKHPLLEKKIRFASQVVNDLKEKRQVKFIHKYR
jgi:hypothetical protein